MLKILSILAILALTFGLYACEDTDNITISPEPQNQMSVSGSATVTKSPDIATSQIGVQTIAKELDPAINENNRKAEAIINALKALGIAEKDIKTISFNIYPQRDYTKDPNAIIGYQVDNMLSVTFRDLTKVGRGLQDAVKAGANNIYGINFTLDNPEEAQNEARILAIQNARKKAESIASAAGIKLGKIVSINESYGSIPIYRDYNKSAAEGSVPVQSGELGVTVQVTLIYLIE
ncbi:TPA: DUF541 domain-containing protein [bacterium]|nr:DUF541 domain-containing protein [bacterium]